MQPSGSNYTQVTDGPTATEKVACTRLKTSISRSHRIHRLDTRKSRNSLELKRKAPSTRNGKRVEQRVFSSSREKPIGTLRLPEENRLHGLLKSGENRRLEQILKSITNVWMKGFKLWIHKSCTQKFRKIEEVPKSFVCLFMFRLRVYDCVCVCVCARVSTRVCVYMCKR